MTTQYIMQYRNAKGDWIEVHVYGTQAKARAAIEFHKTASDSAAKLNYRIVRREFTATDTVVGSTKE
jgi:hypothetical protein